PARGGRGAGRRRWGEGSRQHQGGERRPRSPCHRYQNPFGSRLFARASRSSCSRKSGCASETSAFTRSATDFPLRFTIPYSVTTYMTSVRGVVTTLPGVSVLATRLCRSPRFSYVDVGQMK